MRKVLFKEQEIQGNIHIIAKAINSNYEGVEDVVFLGILNGSFMFFSDLMKEIRLDSEVSFIKISSYEDNRQQKIREVNIPSNLLNKNIIIV